MRVPLHDGVPLAADRATESVAPGDLYLHISLLKTFVLSVNSIASAPTVNVPRAPAIG